jgi:chitosanase
MRDTQDAFFDATYFEPAVRAAERFKIFEPLGTAVVYDSFVHGSWKSIRDNVFGTPESRGERAWVRDYLAARRNWLAGHSRADLRATVYRIDALERLVDLDEWALDLPLVVRGAEISSATLSARPPDCYEGPQPGTRPLAFLTGEPLCRGLDVRLVQLALSERGADIRADGVFGRATAACVSEFQRGQGVFVTGAVEPGLAVQLASEVGAGV